MTDDENDSQPGTQRAPLFREDETPVDRAIVRRKPSTTALQLQEFASLITDFGTKYGVAAGKIDRLDELERKVFLRNLRRNARGLLSDMAKIVDTLR